MNTDNYSSYIVWIDEPDRRDAVESSIKAKGYFTEAVPTCPFLPNQKEVVFLTFDFNKIEYVCLCHSLGNKVTNKATVKFADCIQLHNPIELAPFEFPPVDRILPVRSIGGHDQGRRMGIAIWRKLVENTLEKNPKLKDAILALFRRLEKIGLEEDRVQIYLRRDATNLVLRFAGIDPKELLLMDRSDDDIYDFQIGPPKEGGEPFFESDMITQDQYGFPDWSKISEIGTPRGTVSYRIGNSILRIWNIDHKSMEKKSWGRSSLLPWMVRCVCIDPVQEDGKGQWRMDISCIK